MTPLQTLNALVSIAWRDFIAQMRSGVGVALSLAYVSVSAVYALWLYPFFIEGIATSRPLFEVAPLLLALLTPTLTFNLIAGEREAGRLDTWLALPLTYPQLLLCRIAGAWLLLTLTLLISLSTPLCLELYLDLSWGTLISGYLGVWCVGTQLLCVGLWASVRARAPLSAWLVGFVIAFGLYLMGSAARFLPPILSEWCSLLSLRTHFEHLTRGVIDLRDLAYFFIQSVFWFALAVHHLRAQVNRT